jgi:plastocyanin
MRPHHTWTICATFTILLLIVAVGTPVVAQSPGGGSGSGQFAKWDPKTNTATLVLMAGPFKFNDASSGSAGFTVPSNAKVVIEFVNKDGTPHSAEVISGEGPIPNSAAEPAIPRAYTNKVQEGLPQEASDDITFTAPASGKYRIFCGVPGHGLSGMWIWLTVDPAAKTASFGPVKS